MVKKGWLVLFILLLMPIAYAGVTRQISGWNCGVDALRTNSYVTVTLTQSGATTNYGVNEILDDSWIEELIRFNGYLVWIWNGNNLGLNELMDQYGRLEIKRQQDENEKTLQTWNIVCYS